VTGLIAAIDTADPDAARHLAQAVRGHCAMLKLGLEYFCALGGPGVRAIGGPIFLDLKLHDIPATVAGALGAVLPLGARFVTLHASGGAAMVAAARARAEAAGAARPRLLAVTVLTSLSAADLVGVGGDVRDQVVRLARMAIAAGADGLVCAPPEIAPLRDALGAGPVLVVPGVRPAGWAADDQARIATPAEAARAGADYVVVGRPISSAPDPAAAAAAIAAELA
jgi:orotidine-5'-phosphate decarboxylase